MFIFKITFLFSTFLHRPTSIYVPLPLHILLPHSLISHISTANSSVKTNNSMYMVTHGKITVSCVKDYTVQKLERFSSET